MAGRALDALHAVLHRMGLDVVRWRTDPDFDTDNDIDKIVELVGPFTLTSRTQIVALIDAVEYVVHASIPGAVVECGVWKGGSVMAAALTLLRRGDHRDLTSTTPSPG